MYTDIIMRKALDSKETGIKIRGQVIDNMRYADDTTLVEVTEIYIYTNIYIYMKSESARK